MQNSEQPRCTSCWACRTRIQMPKVDGEYVSEFKCGWCGAITNLKSISANGRHGLLLPSPRSWVTLEHLDYVFMSARFGAVLFVITLLCAVMGIGIYGLLPHAFTSSISLFWSRVLAAVLSSNILINYILAASQSSRSKVTQLPEIQGGTVPKGVYENFRFCVTCQSVKTPNVHHCSVCNECIENMDHHCPFIGNCVGKGNLRSFILFLFWTAIGAIYAMIVCLKLMLKSMPLIRSRSREHHHPVTFWRWTSLIRGIALPWWSLASFYVFVVCFAGGIGVAVLLYSQTSQIWQGLTYIDQLKGQKVGQKNEAVMARFSRVFGGKNPLLWLLPFAFEKMTYETKDSKVR